MTCYKGTTFCTGGFPLCAKFHACSRALTPEHLDAAKQLNLPISTFVLPTAMSCYLHLADVRLPVAKKPRFRPESLPDGKWKKLLLREPRQDDGALARIIGCSTTTVRTVRVRLGIPRAKPPGHTRHTRYTEAVALRVIYARRDGDTCLRDAARRAGVNNNLLRHLRQRFRTTFENHGL